MQSSRPGYLAASALLLGAALTLTGCGTQHVGPGAGGPSPTVTRSSTGPSGPAGPARGNVEPDSHDGAPHYHENNGFKTPKKMSPADEKLAQREADRIRPVVARLWKAKVWDPKHVRAALLRLGYRDEGPDSDEGRGSLFVKEMDMRLGLTDDHPVRPEGSRIALRVRDDACVTAFTQPSNYQVSVNGRFLETGCFEPLGGH
ncbi:hypothetical protein [Streptomyces beihaiensis]|uniref:Lipoprotein n=1 Tax=Streptomyces beihaiensis TaxID=2984495 RepID=A0ABT3TWV7_9ACTN|nr:hypothetical protein [Streptomyces beihaiensis]MCX3061535.1 hypothetical protein [Streptomyces beihaiensis]